FRQAAQILLPNTMVRKSTAFEQKVYEAISRIPAGRVSTYGLVGKAIACKSAQAIGQALKRNPFAPKVPCHRVISSSLSIGGYSGAASGMKIKRKLKLLASEGVRFENGALADHSLVFNFSGKHH
ncbi:MAG: MGMT family protein, partial [Verrucomicrobiaceae bacterium]